MSKSTSELQEGKVYISKFGEERLIVKLLKHMVRYRRLCSRKSPPIDCMWMDRNRFCEWAQGVVE